ncbi:MAG: hypothetical protein RKO25_02165 [Candidatus Contendobacter sp.]|nr:hypothetical protein [Candidatus Contendobacter sp.]
MALNDNGGRKRLTSEYVSTTLGKYVISGYIDNDIFPNDAQITISPKSFIFATNNAQQELKNILDKTSATDGAIKSLSGIDYVRYISNLFAIGTQFEGKVKINQPPDENSVNIYFLKKDPGNLSLHFADNCSFIGYNRAIICDAKFIRGTIDRLRTITKSYDVVLYTPKGPIDLSTDSKSQKMVANLLMSNFMTWVLGHEIGHAINDYEFVTKLNKSLHFDLEYNEKEKAADAFVARAILHSEGDASTFKTMLGEFIQQEFREVFRSTNHLTNEGLRELEESSFPLHNKLKVNVSKYQVPLILRALHVMDNMLSLQPSLDSTGYYQEIEKNIHIEYSILQRLFLQGL